MRRRYSDRLFLFFILVLTFYIGWSLLNRTFRFGRDAPEAQAYFDAISNSTPIIANSQICSLNKVDLLIVIISSGTHFLERQSIRETWGSISDIYNIHSERLFIVGYQRGSKLYKDLANEAEHEQDLLYLTVDDKSPTLKELHAYSWLGKSCPNVTYTFKTEDDLFVNTFILHELIRELQTRPEEFQNRYLYNISLDTLFLAHLNPDAHTFMFGWAFQPGKPERNATMGPYYVSYAEYPKDLYPRYCSGFGYLMDSKTRNFIAAEGLDDKHPFRFSDIYVSGMLPERNHFICDILPFTYNQGTTEECISVIKQHNRKDSKLATPPLIVCSTGRHIAQNTFSDYYRIWTVLKYVYGGKLRTTKNQLSKN